MAFDLTLLDIHGRPCASVSLSPNEHFAIIGQIEEGRYVLLARLRDYYRDADFVARELIALRAELEARRTEIEVDALGEKIREMIKLLDNAISSGQGIAAIAD
jgi:hypothetical protein